MKYNFLESSDAQLASYKASGRTGYPFQMLAITGMTTSKREVVISKVYTSLMVLLDCVRTAYDDDVPEQMSVEQLFQYIGFTVQEGIAV